MAEFEELRLTVSLADNASAGLRRLRAEIGQMTTTAASLTTGLNAGTASLVNFGDASQNAAPRVRSLNAQMRDLQRSASDTGRALGQMGLSARRGLAGMPQIALGLWDASRGVSNMGTALAEVAPAGRIAVLALGGIALTVAAVGAAVVAYGISVFRFSREMDQLARTARQMGMSFADLKNAQDQARAFGSSAEGVIRSFQGVQAAQLDLYKNNSQLRAKLLGQGVDANWISQLATMDPNQARNAIVRYGKALERQALAAGVGANVARAIRNQFGKEFGFGAAEMEHELKPVSPEVAKELEQIRVLSKEVQDIWNPLSVKLERVALEALKEGLPLLSQLLSHTDVIIARVKIEIEGVAKIFRAIKEGASFLIDPWGTTKRWMREGRDAAHPVLKEFFGGDVTEAYRRKWRSEADKHGTYSIWDKEFWGGGTPSEQFYKNKGIELDPNFQRQSYSPSGSNNSNPLLIRASYSMDELAEESSKVTGQLEKLNAYFERMETTNRGGGGARVQQASLGGGSGGYGGGYPGGGGNYGGGGGGGGRRGGTGDGPSHDHSHPTGRSPGDIPGPSGTQGEVPEGYKGLVDPMTGKLGGGLGAARSGHSHQGIDILGPVGSQIYSSGAGTIIKHSPTGSFQNDAVTTIRLDDGRVVRYMHHSLDPKLKVGDRLTPGQPIGTSGQANGVPHLHYDIKRPGQAGYLDPEREHGWVRGRGGVAPQGGLTSPSGGVLAKVDDSAKVSGVTTPGAGGGGLAADRAKFKAEMDADPALREKVLRIAANEQGKHGLGTQAVIESMMNRASHRGRTLRQEAKWTSEGGYYEVGNLGRGALENKEHAAILADSLDKVLKGSNVSDYATDNASQNLAKKRTRNREMEWAAEYGGETFYRPGRVSGAGHVRTHAQWMANMRAQDAATQTAAAAPATPTAGNRGAFLDRGAMTETQKVETEGKLKATVTAPTGTKVEVEGSGAFKETETQKSTKVAETVSI